MRAAPPKRAYGAIWGVFVAVLLFALLFILVTTPGLPDMVASHFNAAGQPSSYMPRGRYLRFMLAMAVGLPVAIVVLLSAVYSRAQNLKLPNRQYWLAPQRIGRTRALLIAHGVWFGIMLCVLTCFVHWLELAANRSLPPHLSNGAFGIGLLVFLIAMAVWIGALMVSFRRMS